jgi:hypothetical protein
MMRWMRGHSRALTASAVVVAAIASASLAARAANFAWENSGQFEACLETQMTSWVNSKAELIINEDPAVADIDDMDVALWAVSALQGCEAQAGHGNQTSEGRFSRHMAHWREHIHNVATAVRDRVGAD